MLTPPGKPQHDKADFLRACKKAAKKSGGAPDQIKIDHGTVWGKKNRAERELGFTKGDEAKIFKALSSGAIVIVKFITKNEKEYPPRPGEIVDSYRFHYGVYEDGYLAYYKVGTSGIFYIKSLHRTDDKSSHLLTGNPKLEIFMKNLRKNNDSK